MPSRDQGIKQSLYFPEDMLTEMKAEARRLDRPLSWLMRRVWLQARRKIASYASAPFESFEAPKASRQENGAFEGRL